MDNTSALYFFMFALSECICLFTGVLLAVLPRITRKSLLFGIRIPEEAHEDHEVAGMKRQYTVLMLAASFFVLAAGAAVYYVREDSVFLLSLYQPTILLFFQFAIYIPLWNKTRRLKSGKGWLVHNIGTSQTTSSSIRGRLKDLPNSWYVVSTLLCVIAAIFALYVYPSLPDTLVQHWNADMQADAWSQKSLAVVFVMPVISLIMILIMLGSNIILFYTKLQVSIENPVLSYAQHRLYRRMMSHMLGFITFIMTVMMLFIMPMQLNIYIPAAPVMYGGIFVFTVLMLIPAIWLPLKAGQAGSRLKPVLTTAEEKEMESFSARPFIRTIDRGDDSFWKFGLFYCNRQDPSLFVEDRFGSNGGINYARPAGKVIAVLIILLVLATYAFSTILFIQMM